MEDDLNSVNAPAGAEHRVLYGCKYCIICTHLQTIAKIPNFRGPYMYIMIYANILYTTVLNRVTLHWYTLPCTISLGWSSKEASWHRQKSDDTEAGVGGAKPDPMGG